MKIVKLEAATVRFELVHPYVTAGYKGKGLSEKNCVIVRLHTDTGLVGIGETDPYPTFTYEAADTVMAVLKGPTALFIFTQNPRLTFTLP